MDTTTLVAALLHDTVEDTSYTLQALRERLRRARWRYLVDGVTKFDKVFYGDAAEAETIRKMIVAAGKDVRVLVDQAGRPAAQHAHPRRPLARLPGPDRPRHPGGAGPALRPARHPGAQARAGGRACCCASSPTRTPGSRGYVHAPARLGRRTSTTSSPRPGRRCAAAGIDAEVRARPRHLYSIWKDTVAGGHADPHDLPRIVVIVDGPETDCYAALGAVHGTWRPVPGRFKDFIASPEEQPLPVAAHHACSARTDRTVEVLIRTEDDAPRAPSTASPPTSASRARRPQPGAGAARRRAARPGCAGCSTGSRTRADPAQFLESLRCDLAEGQIQVFADGRQAACCPAGATPVDLAYELGADVGDRLPRRDGSTAGWPRSLRRWPTATWWRSSPRPTARRRLRRRTRRRAARRRSGSASSSRRTPRCRSAAGSTEHERAAASPSPTRSGSGRATIGLALRKHDRGLASDLPLLRLAAELGYPDLETLLVAVADRGLEPRHGGRAADRPGRPRH